MRTKLFPEIEPYALHMVKVDDLHTLYVEESGNPQGVPVIFLHGGPGSGSQPKHRRYFDPRFYRIVVFDQRGCGKSQPTGELRKNTTAHLTQDIESIRNYLGISKFLVFGGSWGSLLALYYAINFPKRVLGLIVYGIFLGNKRDYKWSFAEGANFLFPDEWDLVQNTFPGCEKMLPKFHKEIMSKNVKRALKAAKPWFRWEGSISALKTDFSGPPPSDNYVLTKARIESHFFKNGSFLKPSDYVLKNIKKIKSIPGVIVQGRYDLVCPFINAWELHKAWPKSQLKICPTSGHASSEPEVLTQLMMATETLKERLK